MDWLVPTRLSSLAWLLFFAVFATLMNGVFVPEPELAVRYPTTLAWAMHLLAMAASILAVAGASGMLPVWRAGSWPVRRRLRHSVVVLVGLALVWVLNDWNILGFRYLGA